MTISGAIPDTMVRLHRSSHSSVLHTPVWSSQQTAARQLAARGQANSQDGFSKLPPVQHSPQQELMNKARSNLQHQREIDPRFAKLPLWPDPSGAATLSYSLNRAERQAMSHKLDAASMQELCNLLPDLPWFRTQHFEPLSMFMMKALTADTSAIASRLLQLKVWFPGADISRMTARRPSILLEQQFSGIPAAVAVLHKWFDAGAIDSMVQEEPLFLTADVEDAISSLNRWMSTTNGAHKLQQYPSLLATMVTRVRTVTRV